jgi:uncharacterized integral membrane protein
MLAMKILKSIALLSVLIIGGLFLIYNSDDTLIISTPQGMHFRVITSIGLLMSFVLGAIFMLTYFSTDYVAKTLEVRKLKKKLKSLEGDSTEEPSFNEPSPALEGEN